DEAETQPALGRDDRAAAELLKLSLQILGDHIGSRGARKDAHVERERPHPAAPGDYSAPLGAQRLTRWRSEQAPPGSGTIGCRQQAATNVAADRQCRGHREQEPTGGDEWQQHDRLWVREWAQRFPPPQ